MASVAMNNKLMESAQTGSMSTRHAFRPLARHQCLLMLEHEKKPSVGTHKKKNDNC